MPTYRYVARDKNGKLINGLIDRIDQDEVIAVLQAKDFIPFSITVEEQKKKSPTTQAASAKKTSKKLRRSVRNDDLTLLCHQASTLLNAGVTLLRTLAIILRQIDSRPLYEAVNKIKSDIEEGHSLHEAIAKHPRIFSFLWVSMIETGEASGQLASSFEHIAEYLSRAGAVATKVKSAMVYPVILMVVCVFAILIFTLKIIPMFGKVYESFGLELPALTMGVIRCSRFMQRYILFLAGSVIAGSFLLRQFINTPAGRFIFDKIKLKLPLLGPLFQGIYIERFAHGLGTLIKSGVPILTGLDIVAKLCGNKLFENAVESVREDVRVGRSMAARFEMFDFFPPIVSQMISVGEETGKLSEMLERVTVYYRDKIDAMVTRMTAAFEPLLLLGMGGIVGVLVIAMYLPIFKIATAGMK